MRVTVCELPDEPDAFANAWVQLAQHVRELGSRLVLLPDMPFCKWFADRKFNRNDWIAALRAHDAWEQRLPELAPAVILASRPVDFGNESYDEGFAWDAEYGLRSVHARARFPDEEGHEGAWFYGATPDFAPLEVQGIRIGFLIGSELWAEDEARKYGREGVDVMAMPRTGGAEAFHEWLGRACMAASVAGAYALSSNRAGPFGGQGWIIAPDGSTLGLTSKLQPFLTLDIELASQSRQAFPQPSPASLDPLDTGVPPYP
jgi:N-carbamoylputrescine amidase